jgi:hypothetical protein
VTADPSLPASSALCIDLGAAFTKVAYREDANSAAHLLRHPDLDFDEHRFCIPSVAARNTETDRWVFGAEAMGLRSGPRVEVYQNWKADLFRGEDDPELGLGQLEDATPEAARLLMERFPQLRALDVASRFLRWLHDEQIPDMLGHQRFRAAQVQLCVPEFVVGGPLASRTEQLMEAAGFRNRGCFTLSEPKANLVGVLTEGENRLTRAGNPNLAAMFGDASVLRALAQPDHAVLFLDVGAFTTDFALANFAKRRGAGFEEDPCASATLGVRLLDDLILREAPAAVRERVASGPAERESFHAAVHGGEQHFLGADPLEPFGLTPAAVDAALAEFTGAILEETTRFLADHGDEHVYAVVLTGGGNNIPGIANRLAAALGTTDLHALYAPAATAAPLHLTRHALRQELVRGASAIGGASILFGH